MISFYIVLKLAIAGSFFFTGSGIAGTILQTAVFLGIVGLCYEGGSLAEIIAREEYKNIGLMLGGQCILAFWLICVFLWLVMEKRRFIGAYAMLIGLSVYQVFILTVYYSFCGEVSAENIVTGWLLCMAGVVIDFSAIYLINGSLSRLKAEEELGALYQKRQEELAYYTELDEYVTQVRTMRHEFANQLQAVYGLLEERNMEKGKRMVEEMKRCVEGRFE